MEDSTTETTRVSVNEKIDSFAEGDLENATEALSALWEIVNKDGDITAPSSTPPTVSPPGVSILPGVMQSAQCFTQADRAGHEPHQLGLCERGAHQVHSQRRPV